MAAAALRIAARGISWPPACGSNSTRCAMAAPSPNSAAAVCMLSRASATGVVPSASPCVTQMERERSSSAGALAAASGAEGLACSGNRRPLRHSPESGERDALATGVFATASAPEQTCTLEESRARPDRGAHRPAYGGPLREAKQRLTLRICPQGCRRRLQERNHPGRAVCASETTQELRSRKQ